MVRRGWLLSLSSVTISHVPAASWPGNDIAPQEVGSEGRHRKQQKRKQNPRVGADQSRCRVWDHTGGQTEDLDLVQVGIKPKENTFLKLHQLFYTSQLTVISVFCHFGMSSGKCA